VTVPHVPDVPDAARPPTDEYSHQAVLADEAVDALRIDDSPVAGGSVRREGVYVDATFGRGGHSRLILGRLAPAGRLIAIDRDEAAIAAGRALQDARLVLVHEHFGALTAALRAAGVAADGEVEGVVDGVLIDLGVSSPQLDEAERGFSFRFDGPLDMRMDQSRGMTAAEWLAVAEEEQIREVLERYGQERFAKQVAKAIVAARAGGPLLRTRQLATLVGKAVRTREPGQDPATRTFQALRIHVNQELEELSLVLPQALKALRPGGRLAVISFHSLEDRIVKNFFRDNARPDDLPTRLPVRAADLPAPRLHIIGKPVRASQRELARNPRARSAVLRIAEKPEVTA
jgi:16S rRNA (cytosine1402-N4)-methyltransferase